MGREIQKLTEEEWSELNNGSKATSTSQTAVEFLSEQIRLTNIEGLRFQLWDAIKQAKEMERKMVIDIVEKSRTTGLTAEYLLLTYGSKGSDETKTN